MSNPISFPVARYRFEFQVQQPIRLPDYAGSMLRGAFGHALRQLACMTRQRECTGCPLITSCPYPAVFAPQPTADHSLQKFSQLPVPYVIEPPAWGGRVLAEGETLLFHQVLIGRALRELPLIVLAWRRALARGVGAGDGTAELRRVVHCGDAGEHEIHRPEVGTITTHAQTIALGGSDDPATSSAAVLHFETPLRLQHNGRALPPDKLHARTLLMALTRRASLLAEFHADGPLASDFTALSAAAALIGEEKSLTWLDWTRFSSRQKQKMSLGGVVGSWQLQGALAPFAPFLKLGEWLHVGKEASFGLGQYRLASVRQEDTSDGLDESRDRQFQVSEKQETKL